MNETPADPGSFAANENPTLLKKLSQAIGVDRAIAFTILARLWGGCSTLVTLFLIAHRLSPAEQGYYYTFGSLVALQIVFELGFSYVILQMASHERARLTITPDLQIEGDAVALARLASVFQKAVRWYSVAAFIMAASILPAGFHFFMKHQQPGVEVAWRTPWTISALVATATFLIDAVLSFMEGCGYVSDIARLRLQQAMAGSVLAWSALLLGHGLFAPSMTMLGLASVAFVWLFRKRRLFAALWRIDPGEHRVQWGEEVWPFQWRIALSWLSGYFIFQIFNPILFAYWGPVEAGRMGMSLTIANSVLNVAVSWISTKSAPFGALIARKEYDKLDSTYSSALKQGLIVCFICSCIAWSACLFLNLQHISFASRIVSPLGFAFLLISSIINIVIMGQAYYLRAHKQEKLLANSVVGAICVSTAAWFTGRHWGANGIAASCMVLNVVGLIWSSLVFKKYRRIWHER